MTYYKTVMIQDGKRVSTDAPYPFLTEYIPGKWITPKYGPAFVCKDFIYSPYSITDDVYPGFEAWEVEVSPDVADLDIMSSVSLLNSGAIKHVREFWDTYYKTIHKSTPSTLFGAHYYSIARSIRLVSKLSKERVLKIPDSSGR